MSQFLKLLPDSSGPGPEVDIDPTFSDLVSEAWMGVKVYIPSTAKPTIDSVSPTTGFIQSDDARIGIKHISGSTYEWSNFSTSTGLAVVFDSWIQIEWHSIAGNPVTDIWVNGTHSTFTDPFGPPSGVNYLAAFNPFSTGDNTNDWIGVDEIGYSLIDRITISSERLWAFETSTPLTDYDATYPSPAFVAFGTGFITVESGGGSVTSDNTDGTGGGGGGGTPHTNAIDLSFISYRAFAEGDLDNDQSIPKVVSPSTFSIDLSAVKYRAKGFGDAEDID